MWNKCIFANLTFQLWKFVSLEVANPKHHFHNTIVVKDNDKSYRVIVKELKEIQKEGEKENSFLFSTPEEETPLSPTNKVLEIISIANKHIENEDRPLTHQNRMDQENVEGPYK